jgi:hypothetical protein
MLPRIDEVHLVLKDVALCTSIPTLRHPEPLSCAKPVLVVVPMAELQDWIGALPAPPTTQTTNHMLTFQQHYCLRKELIDIPETRFL